MARMGWPSVVHSKMRLFPESAMYRLSPGPTQMPSGSSSPFRPVPFEPMMVSKVKICSPTQLWGRALGGGVWTGGAARVGVGAAGASSAQVVPAGDAGGLVLTAGATASGYYVQYGERKLLGISAFIDADTKRRIGLEGEARWLEFHQIGNVHAETYAMGPRYHMNFGRFQPYAKGLVGIGKFNFPYNDAHGSYLVIAAGGGVDYRITRRLRLRLADCEYQYWPQFTFAPMTTFGVSSGLRIRVF